MSTGVRLRALTGWVAYGWLCSLLALCCGPALLAGEAGRERSAEPAEVRVRGLGLLGNRETRLGVERLWGARPPAELGATEVEDAILFIASTLESKGYLRPSLEVEIPQGEGSVRFAVDPTLQNPPPRDLKARRVVFHVDRGLRYFLESVRIDGLQALAPEEGQDFFFTDVALIVGKGARAYFPARLRRSADAIESTLRQQGYGAARARIAEVTLNHETGAVVAVVSVDEGPLWQLRSIRFEVEGTRLPELEPLARREGIPWSAFKGQDFAEEIRQVYYRRGYPDVRVRLRDSLGEERDGQRPIDVLATVDSGGHVSVGKVSFRGHERTRPRVLERRIGVETGEPLNPLKLDRARYRLGRLGVFRSVEVTYEPAEGPVRDPVFVLQEERPLELHLLAGWGSYEMLRGGVEVRQRNLFGRAHRSRLELVQSMKSTSGEYTYSVPEFLGEEVDGTVRLFGLQREERAFDRREYGGTVMLSRRVPWIDADGSVGFTYQSLQNDENELATRNTDERNFTVASIDLSLSHDARDNPLRPRRGYRWFTQVELAGRQLGGELNYQRIEFGAAYHTSWGRGRWVHAGLTHGVVFTLGSSDTFLPVNKRFYPGGESSIRGFGEGEAAPLGPDGRFIGAKTYTLLNLELEQAVAGNWSVVLFTDLLGSSATLSDYPWETELVSVGLGLRYQTLIGPIRLEYGHNVVKRDDDPDGAVHISVGFPF